ncbi:MAG: FHA domain-containing protein [Solirubrobacterales bacterium]
MEMSEQAAGADGGQAEKLRLKVASGNAAGTSIEVEDELVLGRQAEGAGSLGNDIEISRQHARIAGDADGRYLIEDLGSTNGTYVNGRALDSPITLEAGDRIELGASALIVQVSAPPPTPRSTPVTTTSDLAEAGAVGEVEPVSPGAPLAPGTQVEGTQGGADVAVEPAGLPRLSLKIDVDLEAGEITVALDEEGSSEVRFVQEDGRWRVG